MLKAIKGLVGEGPTEAGWNANVPVGGDEPPDLDMLIIEADSTKLRREGISIAWSLYNAASLAERSVAVVRGGTQDELARDLGELGDTTARFVVLIGHSHQDGIGLGSNDIEATPWDVVATWLRPFEPEAVFIVGCRAGSKRLADPLFAQIECLWDVYASPAKTSPPRAMMGVLAVAALHMEGPPDLDATVEIMGNMVSFALAGEFLRRMTWEQWVDQELPDHLLDAIEEGVGEVLDGARDQWKANRRRRRRRT